MNPPLQMNTRSPQGRRSVPLGLLAIVILTISMLATSPVFAGAGEDTYPGKADAIVEIRNFEFHDTDTESSITYINAGDTVKWLWMSGTHSASQGVRGPFGDPLLLSEFDSGVRTTTYDEWFDIPLTYYYHTFETPGVYQYYCQPHWDQQHGVVVVLP